MEDHTTTLALAGTVILAFIGLFRDAQFIDLLKTWAQKHHSDDILKIKSLRIEIDSLKKANRDLIHEKEIASAVQAVLDEVDDDESLKKAKAMKRILKSHGKQ